MPPCLEVFAFSVQFNQEARPFLSARPLSSSELSPRKGFKNSTMRHLRALPFCVLISAVFNYSSLVAQTPSSIPRITEQVDETPLTPLEGSVPLLARAQYDQGEASASMLLRHTAKQGLFKGLHLLLLGMKARDRLFRCDGHNVLRLAHTRNSRDTRNSRICTDPQFE